MTVHALRDAPLHDIPAMLRRLAANIESGEYGNVSAVAVVLEAPQMPVFGFGKADAPNASELFACAHHKLVIQRLDSAGALAADA